MQKEVGFLKAAGADQNSANVNGDVLVDLSTKIGQIELRLDGIEKKLANLARANAAKTVAPNDGAGNGVDEGRFNELESKVDNHIADYDDFKKEVINMLKQLQDQLNDKVDYGRLAELEKLLMDKINEVARTLTKQLADKNETKKNLKMLEKQLKNLLDVFMQKQMNPDEENAMFSKKPLGGFSCASCEKNLINLHSKPPEFYNWNRFPVRDPSERIA